MELGNKKLRERVSTALSKDSSLSVEGILKNTFETKQMYHSRALKTLNVWRERNGLEVIPRPQRAKRTDANLGSKKPKVSTKQQRLPQAFDAAKPTATIGTVNDNLSSEQLSVERATSRKCARCRQRGHESATCTNMSVLAGAPGDPCDICGKLGHAEEECGYRWRSWIPVESINQIPRSQMIVACYNCGSSTHWGDDCPTLPESKRDVIRRCGYSIWSAEHANKFIIEEERESRVGEGHLSVRNYQLDMLDDWRD